MRFLSSYHGFRFIAVFVLVTLVSACAVFKDRRPPEEQVRDRAQAWMDALLARDIEKAFSYTSPNYRQSSRPGRYNARVAGAGSWKSGKVDQVTCSESVCDVRFIIEYSMSRYSMKNTRPLDYRWVLVDGKWWLHVPG